METLPKLKQYIPVDLLRSQDETIDIADSFKGRVGDINSYLKLWVYSNGLAQDIRNWRVLFFGTDPEHNDFRVYLTMADDQKLDQQRIGRVTLYFPDNVFQIGGKWEEAYLSFIDPNGNIVSTVNFELNVLGSNFYARMGQHSKSVIAEFQELVDKLSALVDKDSQEVNAKVAQLKADLDKLGDATKKDFTDWLAKFKQSLTDAMAEINDPKDGLYVLYNQLLDTTKQIQETLKAAQFHDRIFQYATVQDMKNAVQPLPGDLVATQGWEARDDARGGFWRIRVKHDGETPDGTNTILLNSGYVAERNYGIVQDMDPIHMGTVTYEGVTNASGFTDMMPDVHMYVSKYGAGIAQVDVDEAGGSAVSEVEVQPIFDGNKCDIYISPASLRYRMPDLNLETPSSADCDGPNVYVVSNIYTLTLSLKGAKATGFTIDKDFITNYKDLMVTLN